MPQYDSGVSAYRETTKWLVALAPVGSLTAATLTIGPGLLASGRSADGLGAWLTDYGSVLAWCLGLLAGVVAIMVAGARVLSVAPHDLATIQDRNRTARLASAIGSGVAAPEFFTVTQFEKSMAALANTADRDDGLRGDEPELDLLRGPIERLREWSTFTTVRTRFYWFCAVFALGSVAILVALIATPTQLPQGIAVDAPRAVVVEVSDTGAKSLADRTGCTTPDATDFTAVDGTWARPRLTADGPGCEFGATWSPREDEAEVRPAPDS